ncbi:hypothetical protein SH611_20785 [Geminicoccaceae bacterium 1502E]|nr:hypothetical protein [Geminicoccaceae bacterium 1502E]
MKVFLMSLVAVIVVGVAGWAVLDHWPGWNTASVYSTSHVRLSPEVMPDMGGSLAQEATIQDPGR